MAFGADDGALVVPPLAAGPVALPAPRAGFAGVGAGFCAAGGAGAGSGDDICVADVLTPGSRSAGGGATAGRLGVGAVLCGELEALPPLCAPAAVLKATSVATRIPRTSQGASSCRSDSIINLPPLGLAWLRAPVLLKERLPWRLRMQLRQV